MDGLIVGLDRALRVISSVASASRPSPATRLPDAELTDIERRKSAGLAGYRSFAQVYQRTVAGPAHIYRIERIADDNAMRRLRWACLRHPVALVHLYAFFERNAPID